MRDPLPGRITRKLDEGVTASPEWERAAESSLDRFYRSAVRPAAGPVSLSAEAVWFEDYAEMLACLARDFAAGRTLGWWWRAILGRTPMQMPDTWLAASAEEPLHVPAAIEQLQEWSEITRVLCTLTREQALALIKTVVRVNELEGLLGAPIVSTAEFSSNCSPARSEAATHGNAAGFPDAIGKPRNGAAVPWHRYLPADMVPAALPKEHRALLAICLLIRRWPGVITSTPFVRNFQTWWYNESPGSNAPVKIESPIDRLLSAQEDGTSSQQIGSGIDDEVSKTIPPAVPNGIQPLKSAPLAPEPGIAGSASAPQPDRIRAEKADGEPQQRANAEEKGTGEFTLAGGVLYLVHFLRASGLIRHFDTGLSGWALLNLLGRCLLERDFVRVSQDPLWQALARLDGRDPQTPPGAGFVSSSRYHAPESWLAGLETDFIPLVRFRSRGCETWHPEGFLIADEPDFDSIRHLRFRRCRNAVHIRLEGIRVSRGLRRFLHFVVPYARWRLGCSLGDTALRDVLLRKGKLFITRTHVDLVMNMDQISVPARFAGLDANPGWVPDLGRVLNFHFV
ncbi:MAG: hypothetical protein JOY92_07130 [Verrucomicrobia bacterium]|nr:hypothetical protein [Verrucomicrobiota bacterium]